MELCLIKWGRSRNQVRAIMGMFPLNTQSSGTDKDMGTPRGTDKCFLETKEPNTLVLKRPFIFRTRYAKQTETYHTICSNIDQVKLTKELTISFGTSELKGVSIFLSLA